MKGAVRKIHIELSDRTNVALERRKEVEELTATVLFNRAMQVYDRLMMAQENGDTIMIGNTRFTII